MAQAALAQLYLTLNMAEAGQLEALLRDARPACVRLVLGDGDAREVAETCVSLCHAQEVPLLIAGPDETAIALARAVGADGVHLSGAPKAAPWARAELGENSIIGIDPGPSRHDAMIAAETGADYVSLTPDWENDDSVPSAIEWWAEMIETPMVVENAATPERAVTLRDQAEFVVVSTSNAVSVAEALGAA